VAASGELVFAGETRDLKATVAGVLAEMRVREGQRVEKGTVLAVIRPPMDERRVRELEGAALHALAVAEFCEGAAAGRYADAVVPASVADLATEHARLRGGLRVLNAIQQANPDAEGLSPAERERVARRIADARAGHDEEAGAAANDAGTRREELRDAEEALRSAQDDVRMHQRSFGGSFTDDKEEAARLRRDYQRVLTVLRAREGKYLAVANRLRREINEIQKPASPPPPPDATAEIAQTQAALQSVEQRLAAQAAAQRRLAASAQEEVTQLRTAAAPREIRTLQPGCVTEIAALAPGAPVDPGTTIGRLVTRSAWRVRCAFPPEHAGQFTPGQALWISVPDAEGRTLDFDEPYYLAERDPRLIALATSRDDWKDGTPVRVQTTVVAGTLLDRWLAAVGVGR
jgi:multidrug resistance efflux pump